MASTTIIELRNRIKSENRQIGAQHIGKTGGKNYGNEIERKQQRKEKSVSRVGALRGQLMKGAARWRREDILTNAVSYLI